MGRRLPGTNTGQSPLPPEVTFMEKMMLAAAKTKPEPGVSLVTVPVPKIGQEEVLVKVKATGLCGSDIHTYLWEETMHYKEKYLPLILGHEFSGEVVEVGSKVQTVKMGDRVLAKPTHPCGTCWFCRNNQPLNCTNRSTCGTTKNGAFAEYCAIHEDQVVHMPDNMTWEQGAIIEPLGVGTNCVIRSGLKYGDFVVISGPGPIGLTALLAARALGAGRIAVFGTSRDTKRLALARELGADYTFMVDQCDIVQEIKDLTNGQGADVALECVGVSALLQTNLSLVRKLGTVCCAGIYSSPATFNLDDAVRNSKTIIGAYGGYSFERSVQWITGNNELAEKAVRIISHRSSLLEVEDAFQRAMRQENVKEIFTRFD